MQRAGRLKEVGARRHARLTLAVQRREHICAKPCATKAGAAGLSSPHRHCVAPQHPARHLSMPHAAPGSPPCVSKWCAISRARLGMSSPLCTLSTRCCTPSSASSTYPSSMAPIQFLRDQATGGYRAPSIGTQLAARIRHRAVQETRGGKAAAGAQPAPACSPAAPVPGPPPSHPLAADEGGLLVAQLHQGGLDLAVPGRRAHHVVLPRKPRAERLQRAVGAAPARVVKLVLDGGGRRGGGGGEASGRAGWQERGAETLAAASG